MTPKKTLSERQKELQFLLTTPAGREELQQLDARYQSARGTERATRTSVITFILVHEREQGLISG